MAENGVSWIQNFGSGNDFCISNTPSKMTKPEVLGILGLDVGDKISKIAKMAKNGPIGPLRALGALKGPRALWGPYLPFKGYGVGSVAWAKPLNEMLGMQMNWEGHPSTLG